MTGAAGEITMHRATLTWTGGRKDLRAEDEPVAEVSGHIHHRAHDPCYVSNSVTCPVEIE